MGQRISVSLIEKVKDRLSNLVSESKNKLADCSYIDLRLAASEGKVASAQDGMMKFANQDYGLSYGIRVIAGKDVLAPAILVRAWRQPILAILKRSSRTVCVGPMRGRSQAQE